jgi:hypothetical protein
MEVLAIKQKPHKPFEELCPRIWGLVAEANSSFKGLLIAGLLSLDAGQRREIQISPACHTALDGLSFIPLEGGERKGG